MASVERAQSVLSVRSCRVSVDRMTARAPGASPSPHAPMLASGASATAQDGARQREDDRERNHRSACHERDRHSPVRALGCAAMCSVVTHNANSAIAATVRVHNRRDGDEVQRAEVVEGHAGPPNIALLYEARWLL